MLLYLYKDSKENVVHASENKKSTGCRINLTKPENISRLSVAGTVDDLMQVLDNVTCKKCNDVFVKRLMKLESKQMKLMAKEEAKQHTDDSQMVSLAEVQEQRRLEEERRKKMPKDAPPPPAKALNPTPPKPAASAPAANPAGYQETRTPQSPAPAAQTSDALSLDETMAQFALPSSVSAPVAPVQTAPTVPPAPQPPLLNNANDIMAQFAVPTKRPITPQAPPPVPVAPAPGVTSGLPGNVDEIMAEYGQAPVKKSETIDDIIAQFNIHNKKKAAPSEAPKPIGQGMDEMMAQFAINAPAPKPIPDPEPEEIHAISTTPTGNAMDDIMAQFAIGGTANTLSKPAPAPVQPAPVQTAPVQPNSVAAPAPQDDIMAQFAIGGAALNLNKPAPAAPAPVQPAPVQPEPVAASLPQDDIMAQFAIGGAALNLSKPTPVETAPVQPETAAQDVVPDAFSVGDAAAELTAPVTASAPIQNAVDMVEEPLGETMDALLNRFNVSEASPASAPVPVLGAASMAETPDESTMDALMGRYQPSLDSEPYHEPVNPNAEALAAELLEPAPELPSADPSALNSMLAGLTAVPEIAAPEAPVMSELPAAESVLEAEPAPAEPVHAADEFNVSDEANDFDAIADSMFGGIAADVDLNEAPAPQTDAVPPMPQVPPMQQSIPYVQPQFMGYNQTGQPVYAQPPVQPGMPYVQPQFMGYNQAGQPVYAQPVSPTQGFIPAGTMQQPVAQPVPIQPAVQTAPVQPALQAVPVQPAVQAAPVQPAVQAAPVQPAVQAAPVQPAVQAAPVQPAVQAAPVQPVVQTPTGNSDSPYRMVPPELQKAQAALYKPELPKEQGVHVSKISVKHEAEEMPPMMRNAISNSAIKRAEREQLEQQEAAERASREQDINISKIVHDAAEMPDMIRTAMEKAAVTPQENIFDQQAKPVSGAVMNSIEDVLSSIGEDTSKYKKKASPAETASVNIQYEEYKPKNRRSTKKKGLFGSQEPTRPLTKEELRDQKRREKIDAQFKKDLAKRGF